jgi:hypothetical protein
MLQSIEATIDRVGNIRLREGIELPANRKAIVVILPDEIDTAARPESGAAVIEVHFRHPRTNKILVADIKPAECTGQDALNSLLTADDGAKPFLLRQVVAATMNWWLLTRSRFCTRGRPLRRPGLGTVTRF